MSEFKERETSIVPVVSRLREGTIAIAVAVIALVILIGTVLSVANSNNSEFTKYVPDGTVLSGTQLYSESSAYPLFQKQANEYTEDLIADGTPKEEAIEQGVEYLSDLVYYDMKDFMESYDGEGSGWESYQEYLVTSQNS